MQLTGQLFANTQIPYREYKRKSRPADQPGFAKVATLDEVRAHNYALTPGRYVGAVDVDDEGEPFEERMQRHTATLLAQQAEAAKLSAAIAANLREFGNG